MHEDELEILINDAASYMQTLRALLREFALSDGRPPTINTTDENMFREMAREDASSQRTAA